MKPISVKFQCFGPYMDKQFVDFTRLEQNGLFLICGETGAGKTTVLDAICVALYGKSSGGSRGELSEMRCKLAGKDDVTEVEFVFENGGRQYRFTRGLRVARKNETEAHQCAELLDGQWVPMLENPKKTSVNAKAAEIIGLSYDQFRQVIILPQGQFEKLLTSDSQEKENILASLFHTERLERAVEELFQRVKARDDALKQTHSEIAAELGKYECDSLEALAQKELRDAQTLEELRVQLEAARKTEKKAKEAHEKALLENQEFEELARREKKLEELAARKDGFTKDEADLRLADSAERLRGVHTAYDAARAAAESARTAHGEALDRQVIADAALTQAQEARGAHEAERETCETAQRSVILLEKARPVYQDMAKKQETLDLCRTRQQTAAKAKTKAETKLEAAEEAWQAALQAQTEAREAYQSAQRTYLQGIGGVLAQRLRPGVACPVCGSTEHPAPAKVAQGHITDSELDELSKAESDANDEEVKARTGRTQAQQEKDRALDALSQAEKALAEAQADYTRSKDGMIPEIETEEELDSRLATLNETIANFKIREASTQEALSKALSDQNHARAETSRLAGELEQAQAELARTQAAWDEALAGSPLENESQFLAACMEPEKKQQKTQACIRFQTELKRARADVEEARRALKDKTPPDAEALNKALEDAGQAADALNARTVLLAENQKELERDRASLTQRKEAYDAQRAVVDGDLDFAGKLRGRSGVSLQRYVLGVKLSAITMAANRLLETVYGGRYRLYRTDDVAGRAQKSGLELEVYDAAQSQRRSVTSLSGGEKFLVALSLAIGLSTVVQASGAGVHMEAMFIDEGFGSLDNNAVDDAMGILQGIQRNAGMVVGIISHVSRLEETILTKLEVKKSGLGSTIHIHC